MQKNYATPQLFQELLQQGSIAVKDIMATQDGFQLVFKSISDILKSKGITSFLDSSDRQLECSLFFDDWYLYALPCQKDYVYSMVKFREQENDAGLNADGDTPGVTVCFVEFCVDSLTKCLKEPTEENVKRLSAEINRTVSHKNQKHNPILKKYFSKPEAQGSYMIARLYTEFISSFAKDGFLFVSDKYKDIYKNRGNKKLSRIPDFIDKVNKEAGYTVCDHKKIYVKEQSNLSQAERDVILAVFCGNVNFYSFAAEVEFHARFLMPIFRLPVAKKIVYESAIRADMSIDDREFVGFTPYYRLSSVMVKRQQKHHKL